MNIKKDIRNSVLEAVKNLQKRGIFDVLKIDDFEIERPEKSSFGDYSVNIALKSSKILKKSPQEIAENIKNELKDNKILKKVEIAGPGFLNFFLKDEVFVLNTENILKEKENYGKNNLLKDEKITIEYTDPNPFKVFHIGHLMSNSIGESISRILEFSGAKVKRVCYQGDVGLHVAKAIYGMKILEKEENFPKEDDSLNDKINFMAKAYAMGSSDYENDAHKNEINNLNKIIYEESDNEVNKLYKWGKKLSLKHFEEIYKKLGTKFDDYFFESETGKLGKKIVEEGLKDGIFKKSNNAVVFEGEKHGLHTRVFINSEGLPTYEAKELGLAKIKYDKTKYDKSIIVTGNEVAEYFKVVLKAMGLIFPELLEKTEHIPHGMLRLPTGKMSSRTGDVVSAEDLISDVAGGISIKMKENNIVSSDEKEKIIQKISIAAIKYSILKQKTGKDIVFDINKSISFEGGSGPYLQYAYVRTKSLLKKAEEKNIKISTKNIYDEVGELEKVLQRFPEIVQLASFERAPHYIVTYLLNLSQTFNSYYAKNKIISDSKEDSYRLALTQAVSVVLKNGLFILGISVPEKM